MKFFTTPNSRNIIATLHIATTEIWVDIPSYIIFQCVNSLNTIAVSSFINQPVDLQNKSIDWFLYGGNTGV